MIDLGHVFFAFKNFNVRVFKANDVKKVVNIF